MEEIKRLNGGLNLDDSEYAIPPNDYTDALNISHDAVEGSNDKIITPVIANRIGDATYVYPASVNKCIGAYANTLRNTIIQFIWNGLGNHLILEYNLTTRLHTKILKNLTDTGGVDILGFTELGKILSINVFNRDEGDLLFFLDSLGRPSEININLFKNGEYTPVTRDIIDKGKKPPLSPPNVIYDNDTTKRSNSLRNKLFRFKYRFIYDSFEKSTFSPISKVPLPVSILSDIYTNVVTNNNVIRMVCNTGDKNVKSVEIGVSFVDKTNDWSDFMSVTVLSKSSLSLTSKIEAVKGDFYTVVKNTFSGTANTGDIINAYLKQLPNTEILIGTYTVLAGDTLNSVAAGLTASIVSLGFATSPFAYLNSAIFSFDNSIYASSRIAITLANASNDNVDFSYSFYNDSTYPNIDIEESIQIFDYVPDKANAQEMLNGKILGYAGITEGYDKNTISNSIITVNTIAASGTGGGTSFIAVKKVIPSSDPTKQIIRYALSGIPATGTVIEIKVKRKSDHVVLTASTYTTIAGDSIYTVEAKLSANNTLYPNVNIVYGSGNVFVHTSNIVYEPIVTTYYSDMVITAPTSATISNSIATFKWSTQRNIGRAYFDKKGKTNGILYTDKVVFPAYAENGSSQPLIPFINYKINDTPPIWANSFQFYLTKEFTHYIFWVTNSVNKSETAYIYFDVSNFTLNATKSPATSTVLSYTFQDGDRLRVIRDKDIAGVVFNDTYDSAVEGLVVDPTINSVAKTGKFIKIKNIEPFTTGLDATKNYVIELYRPIQQTAIGANEVYYEFGQQYSVIDAGATTRRHAGMITDQTTGLVPAEFNFYEGDAYFRQRTISVSEIGYAIYNVMDRNFVDIYISAVSSVDGRPSIIDLNARKAYYSTLIRHGLAYEANTNTNGLNRFYGKNFDEYDYSFGDVLLMIAKDRQLVILQKYKVGAVTLYSSIGKDANGLTVVFQTDKLLNPIKYYEGDFGIGTCPESAASFNYAIYGCDNIKGVIWRLSLDGLKALSKLYKMNSWANENLNSLARVYGSYDQRLNNYIISKGIETETCVAVVVPTITLPEGYVGTFYGYTAPIIGSLPFAISSISKPAWMTIMVTDSTIVFSGTPTDEVIGGVISFTITNACGTANIGALNYNISEMTPGTIDFWGGSASSVPSGWLLCDHSAISRTTYANLFGAIGTTYGVGDGSTTFNIPPGGYIPVGYLSGDTNFGTVGVTGGAKTVTLDVTMIPPLQFRNGVGNDGDGVYVYGGTAIDLPGATTNNISDTPTPATRQGFTNTLGGGLSHNNLPPFIPFPMKIKT